MDEDRHELRKQKTSTLRTAAYQELLSLVEESWFKNCIFLVLVINMCVLALETDFQDAQAIWQWLDISFLAVYFTELLMRVTLLGLLEFCWGPDWVWNQLHIVTVILGVLEIMLPPMFGDLAGGQTLLMQILNLLRILRMFRIFQMVRRLRVFLESIKEMAESFVGIFVVLFVFIISCAITCTHLLGHGEAFNMDDPLVVQLLPQIQRSFGSVLTSTFTLFQVTTLDNWFEVAEPVIKLDWRWQVCFVIFIGFTSWTMISVLTAVASDSMVKAASDQQAARQQEQIANRMQFLIFLDHIFKNADTDGNGLLDKQEFNTIIRETHVKDKMIELGLNLTVGDLKQAWDVLDVNRSGELTADAFVSGIAFLYETLSTKHVVEVDNTHKRISLTALAVVRKGQEKAAEIHQQNERILLALQQREAQQVEKLELLRHWRLWALAQTPSSIDHHMLCKLDEAEKPVLEPSTLSAYRPGHCIRRQGTSFEALAPGTPLLAGTVSGVLEGGNAVQTHEPSALSAPPRTSALGLERIRDLDPKV